MKLAQGVPNSGECDFWLNILQVPVKKDVNWAGDEKAREEVELKTDAWLGQEERVR